jgi:hypothetical protein
LRLELFQVPQIVAIVERLQHRLQRADVALDDLSGAPGFVCGGCRGLVGIGHYRAICRVGRRRELDVQLGR